jgi:hypothetical protein
MPHSELQDDYTWLRSRREHIAEWFPERDAHALSIIDKVIELLRQEYGGVLPNELFESWLWKWDRVYTANDGEVLREAVRRWERADGLFYNSPRASYPLTEEDIDEVAEFLQQWLRDRYRERTVVRANWCKATTGLIDGEGCFYYRLARSPYHHGKADDGQQPGETEVTIPFLVEAIALARCHVIW